MATTTGSKRRLNISSEAMAASNSMTYGGLNVATEQFVSTQISNLVSSAPAALDTLNELAAALGDDANFSTTMTNALAGKLSTTHDMTLTLNGDASGSATFTNMGNATLTVTIADDSHNHDGRYYTETEVNNLLAGKLSTSGKAADSNLLDGLDSSAFIRSNADDSFSGNLTATANDWYIYGLGARGASAGQYGIGNRNDDSYRQLTFHVPDQAAYSSSGTIPSFGWYSNGAIQLMRLDSAVGDLWLKGDATIEGSISIGDGITLSESTDRPDLLMIKSSTSSWGGLQVSNTSNEGIISLMINDNEGGLYDDQNGEWILKSTENGGLTLGYDNATKLTTTSSGVTISGGISATGGDSSQWNTAYSWGNHASAGYITDGNTNWDNIYGFITASSNITGSSASAAKLTDGGGISTHPGTSNLIYTGQLSSGTTGLFAAINNANSIITVNKHPGDYNSQLGFSSNGNIYYRNFNNSTAYTTQAWNQVWHSGNFSNNSANWNTAYGWGNHASAGYLTGITSGQVTTALGYTPYNSSNPSGYITSSALSGYATQSYVNTAVSNLVDSAPGTLDTLNELAAALGDDPNFATTVTHSIAGKVSKSGDTMSGTLTITGSNGVSRLRIEGTSPTIDFDDTDGDSFYIHVNSNNFYVLADRNGGGNYGEWETPHPLQLEADTNVGYLFSNRIFTDNYHPNADKWTTARTLSLTGDVTGSVSWDGSGNASITTTIADDSHNHVISNIDGLQSALDGKQAAGSYLTTSGKAADSNLLDGLDSSQFLRSDTSDTVSTGRQISFYSYDNIESTTGDQASLEVYQDTSGADAFMQFHVGGDFALYFGLDGSTNDLAVGGWSMGANKYRVYHAGNLSLATLGYTGATNANYITNNNQLTNGAGYITGYTVTSSDVTTALGYTPYQESTALSATTGTFSGDITVNGNQVITSGSNADVKFSVWSGTTYGIGMTSGVTYGGLNDYAMTFCMNNDSDRGFWWGYSGQSKSSGAMSLTTAGVLTVASSITAGGAITGSNLNVSNWDTAYGWGNHAGLYLGATAKAADSNLLDGLDLHTGRNNQANKVVRTDSNGYLQAGWINTTSGAAGTINKIYCSQDDYVRYLSPQNFRSQVTDGVYAPASHAHAIADVTGLQSALDGKQAAGSYAAASHEHDRIFLTDSRGAARAPSYYNDRYAQWDFQNSSDTGAGGDTWHGLLTVAKWTIYDASHRQEQLAFTGNDLKRRTATSDSAWGSWKTILDSSNFSSWAAPSSHTHVISDITSLQSTLDGKQAAGLLDRNGLIATNDWNSFYTDDALRVVSAHGFTAGANNAPDNSYNYGAALTYRRTNNDAFQMYFPEDSANSTANSRKLTYRTGWNGNWGSWKTVVDMVDDTLTIKEGDEPKIVVLGSSGYGSPSEASIELRGDADNQNVRAYRWRTQATNWGGQDLRLERYGNNNGYQLVGRVPKNSYNLEWQGTIIQGLSDSRVKTDVVNMTGGLDKINQIRPVTFDWVPIEDVSDREGADFGFIAQEIEEVIPEVVHTRGDGYKTVMYEKVTPILVQALKEQQAMIEELKQEIQNLKNK